MAPRPLLHTMVAQRAVSLADQFNQLYAELRLSPGYRVDMTAPSGPSTGSGAQALQHIRLFSPTGAAPLLMGNVDTSAKKSVLRTWACLKQMHGQRSGEAFELVEAEYVKFLERVQRHFSVLQISVSIEDAKPLSAPLALTEKEALVATTPSMTDVAAAFPNSSLLFNNSFWVGLVSGILLGGLMAVFVMRAVAK
ncbi:MAG: hypothetical protein K1X64_17700 [Myxococcaceae bacterium]|nr:hypothetical protein [Myxococcaceae bacterium]